MMSKKIGIIVGVGGVLLVLIGATLWKQAQPPEEVGEVYDYTAIREAANAMNTDEVQTWENIKGEKDAPVVIYEYADYQCVHCAEMNPYLNKLVEEYDGKVALVFRGYVLPYSNNGPMAAAAANAAAKQGYFVEMKDILFEKQDNWYNLRTEKFREKLGEYFLTASAGRGDKAKFFEDMQSAEVKEKIAYDMAKGMEVGLEGTPWIIVNEERVKNEGASISRYVTQIREKINAELKKLN